MWAVWLVLCLGWAEPPEPAVSALDEGDRAWFTGRRGVGIRAWRRALRLTDDSDDGVALAAMVRLRLLHSGSNWGALVHGPGIDRGLEVPGDWGWLAVSDFHWLAPVEVGADRSQAWPSARRVQSLGERAVPRAVLHGAAPISALDDGPVDGLGEALREGWVPDRGGWALGVGVVAGPTVGVGLSARWVQPDAFRRGLYASVDGFVALYGFGATVRLETPGAYGATLRGYWVRSRIYEDEAWTPVDQGAVALGFKARWGRLRLDLGPEARADRGDLGALVAGHQGWLRVTLDGRDSDPRRLGMLAQVSAEATVPGLADYQRFAAGLDVRLHLPLWQGTFASQLAVDGVLGQDVPIVRLPTLGGPYRHRGGRFGEFRGPVASVAQVEARHPLGLAWLWGAVFADVGWVLGKGVHGGGGGGLRLVLPPRPHNTLRLDLGVSDSAWQLQVAWGEAF